MRIFQNSNTPLKIKQVKKTDKSVNDSTIFNRTQKNINATSREKLKRGTSFLKQLGFNEPPADKFDGMVKQQPKMARNKSSSILMHLDEKDFNFTHKYKQFKSHSKKSDFEEVKSIIEELLDKHAVERTLTLSEQYILTGYMGKFIDLVKPMKSTVYNSFNITRRLESKNTIKTAHILQPSSSPQKRSLSKQGKKMKTVSVVDQKRQLMNRELARLKFLWQLYKLKCLVCPDLNKVSELSENAAHHQIAELFAKLKTIERSREKAGEQKSLIQVQKVMRSFQLTIKKCLC